VAVQGFDFMTLREHWIILSLIAFQSAFAVP